MDTTGDYDDISSRAYMMLVNGLTQVDHIVINDGDTLRADTLLHHIGMITCGEAAQGSTGGLFDFQKTTDLDLVQPTMHIGKLGDICNVRGVISYAGNITLTGVTKQSTALDNDSIATISIEYTTNGDKQTSHAGQGNEEGAAQLEQNKDTLFVFAFEVKTDEQVLIERFNDQIATNAATSTSGLTTWPAVLQGYLDAAATAAGINEPQPLYYTKDQPTFGNNGDKKTITQIAFSPVTAGEGRFISKGKTYAVYVMSFKRDVAGNNFFIENITGLTKIDTNEVVGYKEGQNAFVTQITMPSEASQFWAQLSYREKGTADD